MSPAVHASWMSLGYHPDPRILRSHCRGCGRPLPQDPGHVSFGAPRSYREVPSRPAICRLCAVLDDLGTHVWQLDPGTSLVAEIVLLLENIVRVIFGVVGYAQEVVFLRSRKVQEVIDSE